MSVEALQSTGYQLPSPATVGQAAEAEQSPLLREPVLTLVAELFKMHTAQLAELAKRERKSLADLAAGRGIDERDLRRVIQQGLQRASSGGGIEVMAQAASAQVAAAGNSNPQSNSRPVTPSASSAPARPTPVEGRLGVHVDTVLGPMR